MAPYLKIFALFLALTANSPGSHALPLDGRSACELINGVSDRLQDPVLAARASSLCSAYLPPTETVVAPW